MILPAWLGHGLLNRHYLWMIPAADLIVFGFAGLRIGVMALRWRQAALRTAIYVLCVLSAMVWIPGSIQVVTRALMGCALASLVASRIEVRAIRFCRFARQTLPLLAVAVIALAGFSFGREIVAEYRALANLTEADPGDPNVLLIVLDTVGAQALSLYGNRRPTSPNLTHSRARGPDSSKPFRLPPGRFRRTRVCSLDSGLVGSGLMTGHPDSTYPTLAEVLGAWLRHRWLRRQSVVLCRVLRRGPRIQSLRRLAGVDHRGSQHQPEARQRVPQAG